jgi:MoaA/NifB/PqqE/SkfB family radical SAM enzyme
MLTPDLSARLLKYAGRKGLSHITVSVDAAEKDLFEKIRRRADFDSVIGNLKALDEMKRARGLQYPTVWFETVAMLMNVHQLPGIVRLVHRLGGKALTVADLTVYEGMEGQPIASEPEYALPFLREASGIARELGVKLELFPDLRTMLYGLPPGETPGTDTGQTQPRVKTCYDPWTLSYIRANGEVIPCCWIWDPLGDVGRAPLLEIWEGPAYKGLREAVAGFSPPEQCRVCPSKGWITLKGNSLTRALRKRLLRMRMHMQHWAVSA